MNDERQEAILIQVMAAWQAGEQARQILARYPAEAAWLEPALRVTARLTAHGEEARRAIPNARKQAQVRAAFLNRAAMMKPQVPAIPWWMMLARSHTALAFLTVVMLIVVVSGGVLGVSAASLPGDPLYGVKRSMESVQLALAVNPVQRVSLEESYNERRKAEVNAVLQSRRVASVELIGAVEVVSTTEWRVNGLAVQVTPDTLIEGEPQVGDFVEVIGHTLPTGQVVAERIESDVAAFTGVIEVMGASAWRISGQRVLVTPETRITGQARLGAFVEVHARRFSDGTLVAQKIEFDDRDLPVRATPTPSPGSTAPSPVPTSRVEPTANSTSRPPRPVEPTETSGPQPTSEPGETPHSTETREPTRTPEPLRTPEPTRSPEPTRTHEPSRTPEPARTPEPTRTHEPLRTPEPTETHEPSRTPEPTRTREPTETPKPK